MNTTTPKTLFRLTRAAFFDNRITLDVAQRQHDGSLALASPITWTLHDPNCALPDTTSLLHLDQSEAQTLMDELWHLGIRPTEGHGSTGQLAATEKHLDHVSLLLTDAFKTVQNVVNASLVTQHQIPFPPKN